MLSESSSLNSLAIEAKSESSSSSSSYDKDDAGWKISFMDNLLGFLYNNSIIFFAVFCLKVYKRKWL